MKIRSAVSLYISLFVTLGSANPQVPVAPKPNKPLFSRDSLAKSVVRIEMNLVGTHEIHRGTGFLVGVPDARLPEGRQFGYLVTNRHIAQAIFADQGEPCKAHPVEKFTITFNMKGDGTRDRWREEALDIAGRGGWVFPDDPGIDLAVLPLALREPADVSYITTSVFASQENQKTFGVAPGDKLITTGFFQHYAGTHQFQPIVREGSLAMIPDDKMTGVLCKPALVYLADVHVIPGNSGSPMFLGIRGFMGGLVTPSDGGSPYLLLGVVSGYMYEDLALDLRPSSDFDKVVHANSGIAVVVPAEQVSDLLSSSALQRKRDEYVRSLTSR